jgi:hypothetical protein
VYEGAQNMDTINMALYRDILIAMLEQAIKDIQHSRLDVRKAAIRWLWTDPFCEELCEWLGYSPVAMREAIAPRIPAARR